MWQFDFENEVNCIRGSGNKLDYNPMMRSVIVVTYQSAETIRNCLVWLVGTLDGADEIIVVDNASVDSTVDICLSLADVDKRIKVVNAGGNLGYSKAVNLGISESKGKTLVFLNPDTEVHPGWIEGLEEALAFPGVGAAGPLGDNVAGWQFVDHHLTLQAEAPAILARQIAKQFAGETVETKFLVGFCLAVRREIVEEVGGLDEDLILGSDDLEYSWRLRLKGYKLLICKDVFVHHAGSVSFRQLGKDKKREIVRQSDLALLAKLKAHYGDVSALTSMELWDCDIFEHVLRQYG